jgi:hypothetical protein
MYGMATDVSADGRTTRVMPRLAGQPIPFVQALEQLRTRAGFRELLTRVIADCPYVALRWELPPVTLAGAARALEFVLVNAPALAGSADPLAFGSYFEQQPATTLVLPIANLGNTALLVVPRPLTTRDEYGHLAAFLRTAPPAQIHALWTCVAETALGQLSDRPLWISTAGAGVRWPHVRIEHSPKYYVHRPYTIVK